jgi:hypothetical protein
MPRKVFVAGEILTAADVNTNLMDQAVMVFADSTARTAAIPTPSEGMITYLEDTDAVEKYDGSAFVGVAIAPAILQVVSAQRTTSFSSASSSYVTMTDASISITPSSTSSKIIIIANAPSSFTSASGAFTYMQIFRGGSAVSKEAIYGSPSNGWDSGLDVSLVDAPASTSSLTYDIRVRVSSGTGTWSQGGSIILMEVAG